MTAYESLVAELGEGLGVEIKIGADRVAEVAAEGELVLMRPVDANEDVITFFSVIATAADGGRLGPDQLEKALSLNLFGRETLGGNIGLFVDSLIYSSVLPLDGVSAEDLAVRLAAFARTSSRLAAEIGGAQQGEERRQVSYENLQAEGFSASSLIRV